jgi:hypothetical protein
MFVTRTLIQTVGSSKVSDKVGASSGIEGWVE